MLRIKGRGATWAAEITPAGEHYLNHGTYLSSATPVKGPRTSGAVSEVQAPQPVLVSKPPKPKASPYVRKTDVMMDALLAAPDKRLVIPPDERDRYARLVAVAERKGLVPDGMSLEITRWVRQSEEAAVWLHPLPEWRTRVLVPVTVARRLDAPTDVVSNLDTRDDVEFGAKVRSRALRILDALVREARSRGYKVRAGRAPIVTRAVRRNEYVDADRRGHLRVQIGEDVFQFCLSQVLTSVEHVPTKAELARAGRGWGPPPKFDEVPSTDLQLVLHGDGAVHWGSRWADSKAAPLEQSLAQALQEAELRHQAQENARLARLQKEQRERREWEHLRADAVARFHADHRIHALLDQVKQLRLVNEVREYATAVLEASEGYEDTTDRDAARSWADWALAYADSIDPLRDAVREPADPQPSDEALADYMYPWSPNGPYRSTRYSYGSLEPSPSERPVWWKERSTPPWRR